MVENMTKKVIVVDDEQGVLYTVKHGLEGADKKYEVVPAGSGKKCLELLENNQIPDLILLDIMMPEMSGWETYQKIKENPSWKSIPIVFLTARIDRVAKDAGRFYGEDYIEKPFDMVELKQRIEKVLKK